MKRTAKLLSSFQRTFAISPLALTKPTVGTASRNETLIVQGGVWTKQIDVPYPELTWIRF